MPQESSTFPEKWENLIIAVVGGDEREQEIARLAATTGATVRAYGFPYPEQGVEGVEYAASPAAAMKDANVVLFPIPGMTMDGAIFANELIIPGEELLSNMATDSHIIMGMADDGLRAAVEKLNVVIHEYEHDRELMLLRAPAIIEAALKVVIENTDITIHKARVCVCGQGNIGTALARTLVQLGAYVTVSARNPIQRANAYVMGCETITIDELRDKARGFDIIMSTVTAPIIDHDLIDTLRPNTLLVDISAPPGSIDLEYARSRGMKAVWARALGRRAPITVGGSQWSGISKTITKLLQREN